MPTKVKYLNKDFDSLQISMQNYIKSYYPDTYNDFHKSSIGGLLSDVAVYVGDVLSYYTDSSINEIFNPTQRRSSLAIAKMKGYKPRAAVSSVGEVQISIIVPATGRDDNRTPNLDYAPIIPSGTLIQTSTSPIVKVNDD